MFTTINRKYYQRCGSGMFIPNPDPDFYPSRIPDPKPRIPDPGTQIPDPTTAKYEKRGKICCPTVFL
jgi:hypothetical protein